MKWLPTKKNKIESFWQWFQDNQRAYLIFDDSNREIVFDQLNKKMSKVNKHLTFEFSHELIEGKREFIISADGMVEAFGDVLDLVESAPEMAGFEIIPFRQPSDEEFEVEYNGVKLTWDDVFFTAVEDEKTEDISLKLYLKNLTEENEEAYTSALFILLDTVIGEFNMGAHVAEIELFPFEENPHARPIREVQQHFGQ